MKCNMKITTMNPKRSVELDITSDDPIEPKLIGKLFRVMSDTLNATEIDIKITDNETHNDIRVSSGC